jgi:threonine dehydrogenase-like Zn-dependent dehydrogenase
LLAAGLFIEAGSGVEGFEPGDRVVINPVLGCEARDITPVCPSCQQGRSGSCENVADGGDTSYYGLAGFLSSHKAGVQIPAGALLGCLGTGIPVL